MPVWEDAVSEVSEVELREFLGERGAQVQEPGVGGEMRFHAKRCHYEPPTFPPLADFMASAGTA